MQKVLLDWKGELENNHPCDGLNVCVPTKVRMLKPHPQVNESCSGSGDDEVVAVKPSGGDQCLERRAMGELALSPSVSAM